VNEGRGSRRMVEASSSMRPYLPGVTNLSMQRMKTKFMLLAFRALLVAVVSGTLASCASDPAFSPTPRHTVGPAGLRMMPLYPPLPT
jgi:hypothetical protein